jgi:hypothetical protein
MCQDVISDAVKPFARSVPGRKSSSVCRRVRELHFVDIVDVEQLLDVMGQDVPQVAERVQGLLLPSYFPGACTHSLRV